MIVGEFGGDKYKHLTFLDKVCSVFVWSFVDESKESET